MELVEVTRNQAMAVLILDIMKSYNIQDPNQAEKLVLNALCYNVVIEEVRNQVEFLLEETKG